MSNSDQTSAHASFPDHSFTHVVVGDVVQARQRLAEKDTPTHRRELIRSVSAALEGLNWNLKQSVVGAMPKDTSIHELAALLEETYSVDENGVVRSQPRFLPLPTAIRLVVRFVQRFRPRYQLDFTHVGWSHLKSTVSTRNRLVHPKTMADTVVTDEEVSAAMASFDWLLAFVIEVREETLAHLRQVVGSLPATLGKDDKPGSKV